VQAADLADGLYITAHDFPVSNRDWRMSIIDSTGKTVFGPAGEGIYPPTGVGGDEVLKLEADPGPQIHAYSNYNDGASSSFGAPNRWNGGAMTQNFSALRAAAGCPPDFPGDLDGDHDIDEDDLLIFIACASGPSLPHNGTTLCRNSDLDRDGDVDQTDFARFQRCISGTGNPGNPSCAD
jgi:hypothetical protein